MTNLVNTLRARPGVIGLGAESANSFIVRVQMPDVGETLAFRCSGDTTVLALKQAALDELLGFPVPLHEFVMKLRGFEVLDESQPLEVAGARDGSSFYLSYRHRRPVR